MDFLTAWSALSGFVVIRRELTEKNKLAALLPQSARAGKKGLTRPDSETLSGGQ